MLLSIVINKISSKQNLFLLPFPPSSQFPLSPFLPISISPPSSSTASAPSTSTTTALTISPSRAPPSPIHSKPSLPCQILRFPPSSRPRKRSTPWRPILLTRSTISSVRASQNHSRWWEKCGELGAKMKKSASNLSMFVHIETEEEEVVSRPTTMRPRIERREAKAKEEDDDEGGEVDARVDDFINQFRQ